MLQTPFSSCRMLLAVTTLLAVTVFSSRAADTTYVRYNTTLGPIDIQLLPDEAPHNVANFLSYVDSGAYANSLFHRSFTSTLIQGGGYYFDSNFTFPEITPHNPVIQEFHVSNTRGTLAMAQLGSDPNSATDEWFFNDADNSASLDVTNGGYTVFGRVANTSGLQVLDALDTVPTYNGSSLNPAFGDLPLIDYTVGTSLVPGNFLFVNSIVREALPTQATVTISNLSCTSTGAAQGATVTTNPPNLPVIVTYNNIFPAPSAVGSYAVSAVINAPGYYGGSTGTFAITSAVSKTAATITLGGLTPGYDGKAHPATATTTPSGLNVTYLYNGLSNPPVNTGTYTVVATINDSTHSGTATGKLVLAKALAPASMAGLSVTGKVASGTAPHFATSGTFRLLPSASDNTYGVLALSGNVSNSHGTYTYAVTSYNTAVINYTDSTSGVAITGNFVFKSATAGTYTLTAASFPGATETGSFTLNNGAAPATLAGWNVNLSVAAGLAPLATTGSGNVAVSNSSNTYQITGQNSFPTSNGTFTYSLTSPSASSLILTDSLAGLETATLSWTSAKGGNYFAHDATTGFQEGTFTATPPSTAPTITSSLTASTTLFAEYSYQITASGGVATFGATGLPAGLSINPATGLISGLPTQAGVFNVGLTAANSATGKATLVLTIPKAAATVTLGGLAATYTGKAISATVATVPENLKTTVTYDGKTTAPITLGNHTVVATINDTNYTGSATGTLVISPGTATITFGNLSLQYTGKPIPATATTTPAGLAVTFAYNGSATAPTADGSYPVVATINNPNYTGTASGTLIISPVLATATTGAATLIAAKSATLNATINPKSTATTVKFEYGPTTAYGTTTSTQNVSAGTANVAVTTRITGLTPKTLYHFRVVANIGAGYTNGVDKTFTTVAAPVIAGSAPTPVLSSAGAGIAVAVNPEGVATKAYFQYGTTTAYGSQTVEQSIGAGTSNVSFAGFLSGLQPNTLYHYRLVTDVNGELTMGPDQTFTTLAIATSLVAKNGDAAAGLSNVTFSTFGYPAINEHDAIAFASGLAGTGITSTNGLGIFADDNTGTRHLIVQLGGTAPGTNSAIFTSVGDPVFNNNAATAFGGQLKIAANQATSTTSLGIWSNAAGSLQLVARQGDVAPGTGGATFGTFNALGLSDAGAVILGTLTTNASLGVSAANNFGIWEGTTTADLGLVLRTGDTVGGKTIGSVTLFSAQNFVTGQTRNFASNTGDLVAGATFTDKTTGIVKVVGGIESLVATKGDTAAGTSGATFLNFGMPIINTNDHVAYAATLTTSSTVTTVNNTGVWAENSSGTLQLIARAGTTAPGTTAAFVALTDPVYNDNEAVAFGATLKIATGQATSANALGVWCNSTGSLLLVARQGSQAAGCPTNTTFASFPAIALPNTGGSTNKGGPAFLATLTIGPNVTAATNTGIWAVDSTGTVRLIVRTGDLINGKTLTSLIFLPSTVATDSQSRSFTAVTGDLVYKATFSDQSTALYNVQFP